MAILRVLGSSSKGNGYSIECEKETLLIELGVPYLEYVKHIPCYEKIVGCLVSHRHGDHLNIRTANVFSKLGVRIYSNKSTKEAFSDVVAIKDGNKYRIGEKFLIQPICVPHSVENYAYIIEHEEFGKLVFATDLNEFNYNVKNVNHWVIEANYDPNIRIDNTCEDVDTRSHSTDHLSIQQCSEIVYRNYCKETMTVVLIHLSDDNSNEEMFVRKISEDICSDNVFAAKKGMSIELLKEEF